VAPAWLLGATSLWAISTSKCYTLRSIRRTSFRWRTTSDLATTLTSSLNTVQYLIMQMVPSHESALMHRQVYAMPAAPRLFRVPSEGTRAIIERQPATKPEALGATKPQSRLSLYA
jgi:hypothetical protein